MQEEIIKYLNGAKNGNNSDIDYVFSAFRGIIYSYAKKLQSLEFDFEDATQEGNIGLFKAVLTYNETKNASFQTYANKCILNNMLTAKTKAGAQKHQILTNAEEIDDKIYFNNPETDLIIKEQNKEFIKIAKEKLSSYEFVIFCLYTMRYSYQEIAVIVNKDEKSVNNAVQRIHKKLRK